MGCTSSNDAAGKVQLMKRDDITEFKNKMDTDEMYAWAETVKQTQEEMITFATMKPEEKKKAVDEAKAR